MVPSDEWFARNSHEESSMTSLVTYWQTIIRDRLDTFLNREEGQDMIEYALLAALISIVAIAIIVLVGPYLKDLFQDVVNGLGSA
jgi:pilus assembly protein Flp/PilA